MYHNNNNNNNNNNLICIALACRITSEALKLSFVCWILQSVMTMSVGNMSATVWFICFIYSVGGGCVYVLQMFFFCIFCIFCFLFFFRPSKIWDNRSPERLNGFSWNFYQTIGGGECSLKRRAAAWRKSCRRLANDECWWMCNLRYDSFAITRGCHVIYAMTLAESPEGATGGCVIQEWAGELM